MYVPLSPQNKGFVSNELFAFVKTSEVLVDATLASIGYSFLLALVCLLVMSQNFIIAGLASLTILGIVLCILAYVSLTSSLGILESIVASLLVGLSVDYSAHLCSAFNEAGVPAKHVSSALDRLHRARSALHEMGVSVVSGAITTLVASFFLFFAQLRFFVVFGQFIFVTIAVSVVWACVCLMALLMVLGPARPPTGDVAHVLRWLGRRCGCVAAPPPPGVATSASAGEASGGGAPV